MERHNIRDYDRDDRCEPGGSNCPARCTLGKPDGIDNK